MLAFAYHGPAGAGEMLACLLRPGNGDSNTAADYATVIREAPHQAGVGTRPAKKVLVRVYGAGATKKTLEELVKHRVSHSIGYTLPANTPELYRTIPKEVCESAYDPGSTSREGADVAELTGLLGLAGRPKGMRMILRRERPHPGAPLRFDDVKGYQLTAFATNTERGQVADLEVRHHRRAPCEDQIRVAKGMGLRDLPSKTFAQNRIWCQIVGLAREITTWMGLLAHAEKPARRWEPNASGSVCVRSRRRSPATPAPGSCTSRTVPTGPASSRPVTPGSAPYPFPLDATADLPLPAHD